MDNDTAQFAVAAIKGWWEHLGARAYPNATSLTITADRGGSNSYRTRLWKTQLQAPADELGLPVRVLHYPPGTSKWNKIEHRLFSYISINWRAKPLISRQVVIDLIAATTTTTGLKVYARLDTNTYPTKIQITDEQIRAIQLTGDDFHPEWNYTIIPSVIKKEPPLLRRRSRTAAQLLLSRPAVAVVPISAIDPIRQRAGHWFECSLTGTAHPVPVSLRPPGRCRCRR